MNQTINYIKELITIASPTGLVRFQTTLVHTLEERLPASSYSQERVSVTIKGQNDEQQRYVTAHVNYAGCYCSCQSNRMAVSSGSYWWFPLEHD